MKLARSLRTTEYFALAFGAMVGVGWLVVIDDWLIRGGPAGAMLAFLIGGIALIPVGYVYGKFVREIPDASSELAYASTVFSSQVGFLAAWLMTLAYLIVCPWEAVAIGRILAYLIPPIQSIELYHVGQYPVYLPSLLLGLGVTALIVFVNYRGIRISSRFQNVTTFGLLTLFALFTALGFSGTSHENYQPLFAKPGLSGAAISIILVLQIVPYFLTGFESVPKCSEEAEEGFASSGFVTAIFAGLAAGVIFYVAIIGVVSGLVPWQPLSKQSFATAEAFRKAFGSEWIVRLILAAALVSLLKVFNANFLAASRLIFALGRRNMIPSGLGILHPQFLSPANAIFFCGAITALGAFLGRAILIPVTEVGSMCSAVGWAITCISYARWSKKHTAIAWLGATVAIVFVLLKVVPWIPGSFRLWEYVALAAWCVLGFVLSKAKNIP